MAVRGPGADRLRRQHEEEWRRWVKQKIEFYISTGQWDNVTIPQLRRWLTEFHGKGQGYALALLDHFIYYPETQVKRLCRYALMEVLFKDDVLEVERSGGFRYGDDVLRDELSSRLQEVCVVPVLVEGNPSESGNAIARIYTTTGLIHQAQVIRPDQITTCIVKRSCKRFLLVDDFLGSGDQLDAFWNEPALEDDESGQRASLASVAASNVDVSFDYVALVATSYGLAIANKLPSRPKIHFCEELSNEYRVLDSDSIFFANQDERDACEAYLASLAACRGINARGYKGLDYAVAFHHGTPDTCLPIFWQESEAWTPLFQRRM